MSISRLLVLGLDGYLCLMCASNTIFLIQFFDLYVLLYAFIEET